MAKSIARVMASMVAIMAGSVAAIGQECDDRYPWICATAASTAVKPVSPGGDPAAGKAEPNEQKPAAPLALDGGRSAMATNQHRRAPSARRLTRKWHGTTGPGDEPTRPSAIPAQEEALFREFIKWHSERSARKFKQLLSDDANRVSPAKIRNQ